MVCARKNIGIEFINEVFSIPNTFFVIGTGADPPRC